MRPARPPGRHDARPRHGLTWEKPLDLELRSRVYRLRFIRRAQATGLTLDDIRELLRVQQLRTPETCRRVAARLRQRIGVLDLKIAELEAFRGELAQALAQCEEGAESCPVILTFAREGS